jgi:predicted ATPase
MVKRGQRLQRTKGNLREIASSFVGRAADLAELAQRFRNGARLVTLIGPGGIGKTRLAVRFAHTQLGAYARHGGGGVWLSDLTEARGAAGVTAGVGAALGIRLHEDAQVWGAGDPLGAAIARMGRVLMVLDNFEHLVAEAAGTVGAWLAAAPQARFLVTSRTALGVPGEELWPVKPLFPKRRRTCFFNARGKRAPAWIQRR